MYTSAQGPQTTEHEDCLLIVCTVPESYKLFSRYISNHSLPHAHLRLLFLRYTWSKSGLSAQTDLDRPILVSAPCLNSSMQGRTRTYWLHSAVPRILLRLGCNRALCTYIARLKEPFTHGAGFAVGQHSCTTWLILLTPLSPSTPGCKLYNFIKEERRQFLMQCGILL